MPQKLRDRRKYKGRSLSGTFTQLPHAVQDCVNWHQCSATAIKLLLDVARQYNGSNNGDLCATLKVLRKRGWTRGATISAALHELRHYGLLQLTRQGGLNSAGLYAITWKPIDECGGKLDCASPSRVASGLWKEPKEKYRRPNRRRKKAP